MIKEILTAAGVLHRHGRFLRLPTKTCAIYFDNLEVEGADPVSFDNAGELPRIYHHDVTIELYEPEPDDEAEAAIEAELEARGIPWTKEDRYWLSDSQRYQVLYEFSYTNKRRTI